MRIVSQNIPPGKILRNRQLGVLPSEKLALICPQFMLEPRFPGFETCSIVLSDSAKILAEASSGCLTGRLGSTFWYSLRNVVSAAHHGY